MEPRAHRAKKSLGQNFLRHPHTAERIVKEARVEENEVVVEIGPGTGVLTHALLKSAKKVIAVETDDDLLPLLKKKFAEEIQNKKLELLHADIRSYSFPKTPFILVANVPFYITGEILRVVLEGKTKPGRMTVVVQKEVAERIARDKKSSILKLSVSVFGTPRYAFTIPAGGFSPQPNVDAAVLCIEDIKNPFKNKKEEEYFFNLIHAGFAQKRKRLAKNLEPVCSKEKIGQIFSALSIEENARAEELTLSTWKSLAHKFMV